MIKKTILPPDIRGVMTISGYRGTGKSTLASQADLPENIIFFDFENKGEGIHNQLHFGRYVPVTQMAKNAKEIFSVMQDEINKIEYGEFTVAVLDNISPLELALQAEAQGNAVKYANEYGMQAASIMKNTYGAAKGVVNYLIGDAIASRLHEKGVQLVIATSHVKPAFQVDNKFNIKGATRWQELSILSLVLIDGEYSPIPAAIVMKEQLASNSVVEYTDEQLEQMMRGEVPSHKTVRRLPYRLPKCDWQSIRHYLYYPADLENPADGEVPTLDETDPFSEKLSKEQIAIKLLTLQNIEKLEKMQEEAEVEIASNNEEIIASRAVELDEAGMPLPVIVNTLKEEIKDGKLPSINEQITIGKVAAWTVGE